MKLDLGAVLREAWGLFRRDRDLLVRIAGPFLFLPAFALALLVPAIPMPDPAIGDSAQQVEAWLPIATDWVARYGGWYLLVYVALQFANTLVFVLYLDSARPSVGQGMRRALGVLPRMLLAMMVVAIPAGVGLRLLVLPGFYVLGRAMPVGPMLVAERPMGALRALRRSWTLGRGNGLSLTALIAAVYGAGMIASLPFLALDRVVRGTGVANPVTLAIVDGGAACVAAAAGLAQALIAVVVYRRLVSRGT